MQSILLIMDPWGMPSFCLKHLLPICPACQQTLRRIKKIALTCQMFSLMWVYSRSKQ